MKMADNLFKADYKNVRMYVSSVLNQNVATLRVGSQLIGGWVHFVGSNNT